MQVTKPRTLTTEYNVSSTKLKDGREVQSHTLVSHIINPKISEWESGEFPEYVAFWTFDQEAEMPVETLVHWTRITQYMCRKWPSYGEIKFVMTNKGKKLYAKCYVVGTTGENEYNDRPLLLQLSAIRITTLCSGRTLLEIKGAHEYAWSKRDQAAKDKFNVCPFEVMNREFRERMAALQKSE